MTALTADLCVIGAGAGGLSVAAGAAQLGRKVVLIEQGEMGGDCLNFGCVPSKSMIAAAARAALAEASQELGVAAHAEVDLPAVIDHVERVIAAIAPHDSQERFESLGVTVVRARAVFVGPREVEAGPSRIRARHFVIATGSSPAAPSIPGLKETPFFTNETIFRNRTRPEHLIVVGGGPIGVELAQAFRRLGSNVTLVEALRILNNEDEEAAAVVRASLEAEGVIMREQAGITRVRAASGGVEAELGPEKIRGSHLLVATGRRANIDDMGLEKAGVGVTKKGVAVDSRLRTQNKRIYAVGDAAGGPQFTHLAADHASTVVRNILFKIPAKRRDHLAPRVTFTDPELASIGKSEVETRELGGAVTRWDFTRNDRAATERRTEGFVKAMTDRRGKIIGAVIAGPGAGELIAPYALALAKGLRIKAFTDYIAPYPTRGEALKRAAGAYYAPALFSARARALVRLLALFD